MTEERAAYVADYVQNVLDPENTLALSSNQSAEEILERYQGEPLPTGEGITADELRAYLRDQQVEDFFAGYDNGLA